MRQLFSVIAICVVGLLVIGCSSVQMSGSWKKPGYSKQVSKVYVVGVSASELVRRMFEDGFARRVESFGVIGVSSYKELIYADEDQEEEKRRPSNQRLCSVP